MSRKPTVLTAQVAQTLREQPREWVHIRADIEYRVAISCVSAINQGYRYNFPPGHFEARWVMGEDHNSDGYDVFARFIGGTQCVAPPARP